MSSRSMELLASFWLAGVEDVDADMRRSRQRESRSLDPTDQRWGLRTAHFADPEATLGDQPILESRQRDGRSRSVAIAARLADTRSLTGFSRAPGGNQKCARASCPNGGKKPGRAACSAYSCWLFTLSRRGNLPALAITWPFSLSPKSVG